MIKLCIISGVIAAVISAFFITGYAGADETVNKSIAAGNAEYAAFDYEAALYAYNDGIEQNAEHKTLGFNAAQTAYALGVFDLAAACYAWSADSADKYLGLGNACYHLGEASEDPEEQLQCYLYALQAYYDGILAYPENVGLKYNYEFVSELIDVTQEESDESEQGEGEGEDSDEQDENGEGEDGDDNESEENDNGDAEDNEDEQPEQDEYEPAGDENEDENEEQSREEIERILAILESQEEESLKNNRELRRGEEGRYGW